MEDVEDLVYDIHLCGICQFSENLNFTSMLEENMSEYGTTNLDLLKYIFPDVEWIIDEKITPLICKVCLETIKEIVDFKKICLDMNCRRAFDTHPNISVREQIKIEIVPDDIEESLMDNGKDCTSIRATKTIEFLSKGHTLSQNQRVKSFEVEEISKAHNLDTAGSVQFHERSEEYEEEKLEERTINNKHCTIQSEVKDAAQVVNLVVEKDNETNKQRTLQLDGIAEETFKPIIEPGQVKSIYQAKFSARKDERQCKECKQCFSTWEELKEHVGTKHIVLRKFRCNTCMIGFSARDALYRHMYKHNGVRNYVCTVCGRKYITRGDLTEHTKFHETDAKHGCTVCSARFKTVSNLRTHALVHTDPKDYKFLCVMCGNKYSTSAALADHILHRHNTRSIPCTMCSKKFYAQKDLTRHMIKHSEEYNLECHICNKRFKRKHMLGIHLTKEHGIGNYKYQYEKKYKCDICLLKFTTKPKLQRHMRTHTGVRPFKCRLCNTKFICTSYIQGHLRHKHNIDVNAVDYDTTKYYDVEEDSMKKSPSRIE